MNLVQSAGKFQISPVPASLSIVEYLVNVGISKKQWNRRGGRSAREHLSSYPSAKSSNNADGVYMQT